MQVAEFYFLVEILRFDFCFAKLLFFSQTSDFLFVFLLKLSHTEDSAYIEISGRYTLLYMYVILLYNLYYVK